jgi:hypothetical protein
LNDTPSAGIREHLRRDILSGRLAPGERLPTERQLALRFGVSGTTINKVMTALELDGLLERRRGTGTFVRPALASRALAVVLGPPDAPPGPGFWASLLRCVLDAAVMGEGGVRTYLAVAETPPDASPLALDAAAGRLRAVLSLGAGQGAAGVVRRAGLPLVRVEAGGAPGASASGGGFGPSAAVRIAWPTSEGAALALRMAGQGGATHALESVATGGPVVIVDPQEIAVAALGLVTRLERGEACGDVVVRPRVES